MKTITYHMVVSRLPLGGVLMYNQDELGIFVLLADSSAAIFATKQDAQDAIDRSVAAADKNICMSGEVDTPAEYRKSLVIVPIVLQGKVRARKRPADENPQRV